MRDSFGVEAHQLRAGCISSNRIVGEHDLPQETSGAVEWPVSFHCHDAVRDNEVDRNGGAQIENALLNALPVEDILRPSVSRAGTTPNMFFMLRVTPDQPCLIFGMETRKSVFQHSPREPEALHAGIARAEWSANQFVAVQVDESDPLVSKTRDTARGLIVSMSDVLFDTGKYTLKPGAREKLSKVAGILISYPGLNIAVGGYTDNVGTDQLNQGLSEERAGAVRDYLVQQGVSTNSITATGFGNTLPVASNDNSAGRQENRRVELVVSGESIGNDVNVTTGSLR